ncbi:MAG: WxcM-like domain-containing protein [Verrucomicrobia bacterium]|nr:WxcM-like domain-containing protein [Verrucomicrobiota bacterium]MCF7707702.1 WxcM-like domain-containing protein [Verrucomicrobiota bacterium]
MELHQLELEKISAFRDDRGWVFEPLFTEEFADQKNAHLVCTRPGYVRGNHFHKHGTEIMAIEGPAIVRTREGGQIREATIPDGEFRRLIVPPGVTHAMKNSGDHPTVVIAFNSEAHDKTNPDTFRDVILE